MVFFLAFLVIATIFAPMIASSQLGRVALSCLFTITLISGVFTTIRHRVLIYLVVILAVSTLAADLIDEYDPHPNLFQLETVLKLFCLAILVIVTLKQTLRPGPVTLDRVMGGICGYLLIGYTWTFAYQLVVERAPSAIHFPAQGADFSSREPTDFMYFSFVTLATVGYGDAYPVHPVARSLAVAEALVGQLYIAILISSLVGMALQTKAHGVRSVSEVSEGALRSS